MVACVYVDDGVGLKEWCIRERLGQQVSCLLTLAKYCGYSNLYICIASVCNQTFVIFAILGKVNFFFSLVYSIIR